jgi:4-hydroxybenzoate polyprenyl transferase
MRSAGCIVNDIYDKNFDKKVERTKNRPIASGKISTKLGLIYVIILCLCAFLILINFNKLTIILALCSIPFAFLYPLMKRITYWPQLFLGITFNYGLILGWISIHGELNIIPLIMYFGAIFWTLGYDTIYGFQDIKDDEIVGVKSTSIKFKNIPFAFLIICYSIFLLSIIISGIILKFNYIFFMSLTLLVYHLFFKQIAQLNIAVKKNCLKIFNSNNEIGLIIFASIVIGKILS